MPALKSASITSLLLSEKLLCFWAFTLIFKTYCGFISLCSSSSFCCLWHRVLLCTPDCAQTHVAILAWPSECWNPMCAPQCITRSYFFPFCLVTTLGLEMALSILCIPGRGLTFSCVSILCFQLEEGSLVSHLHAGQVFFQWEVSTYVL